MSSIDESEQSRPRRGVVFVSHEKSDDGLAHEIRTHLEAGGFACWMAPDDIRGPTPWPEQIAQAIDTCDVMLVIVSDHANGSPHVSREVDLAVEKAKPLLPVRVEEIVPTGSLDYLLRLAQWIDLFPGSIADHATTLQGMVSSMLIERGLTPLPTPESTPPPGPTTPTTERERPRIQQRTAISVAAVIVVAAMIAIGVALTNGDDGADLATVEPTDPPTTDEPADEPGAEASDAADEPASDEPAATPTVTGAPPQGRGTVTRVSVATDGTEANDHSANASISADGRWVAFDSLASNLVEGDNGAYRDVFVHDRQTGETTRISHSVGDDRVIRESNGGSHHPRISEDGRYVVFVSDASNLNTQVDDTNNASDIFLHDRQTGDYRLISLAPDGTQHELNSIDPSMSDDGTLIAYATTPEDATPPFGVLGSWTYLTWAFDIGTGTTSALADLSGLPIGHDYWAPVVARDGTVVISGASVGGGATALVVFDRELAQTTSIAALQGVVFFRPALAPDGTRIVFASQADWLVADDINAATDTFSFDLETGEFSRVAEADSGDFFAPPVSFSSDGRYVALAKQDNSVLLLDTADRSSTTIPGIIGTNTTDSFELSGDGRWGTFSHASDDLVDLDSNGRRDVFVIQLGD